MGKKKKEHIVFDQMLIIKKKVPFRLVNKTCATKKKISSGKEGNQK